MLSQEIIINRLALIKYLYKMGLEQSQKVEMLAAFSILSFHDSIEMFLKLLADHNEEKSDSFFFMDYWTHFPTLTLKESMRNLNARRTNLKHKGLLPSKSDVEVSRVNTTEFFDQNVITQFGLEFKDISLINLISYSRVRSYLIEAQSSLDSNNFETCIQKSAIAFKVLLFTYEESKEDLLTDSPFVFGKDLGLLHSHRIGIRANRELSEFVDRVIISIEKMHEAIKILSLGIDYKRYAKFKLLTPKSIGTATEGEYVLGSVEKKKLTIDNCQFCIDFIIDCCLKLQEFDFDISEIIKEAIKPTRLH